MRPDLDMRRLCQHCGAEIPDAMRLGTEHCSRACQTAAYWAFIRADTLARKAGRTCAECGGPIPARRRAEAIYCSRECNQRAGNRAAYQRRKSRKRSQTTD